MFKRAFARFQRKQLGSAQSETVTRVMTAYDAILVSLVVSSNNQRSDWKTAEQQVAALKAWRAFSAPARAAVLAMLHERLQRLALQAFLIRHAAVYGAVTVELLAAMFGLSASAIRSETNALVVKGLVNAMWNEDATVLVFEEGLPSRVETLALQLVEKLRDLEEANEVVKDELRGERRDVSGRGRHAGTFGLRPAWMKKENRMRGK